MTPMVFWIIIGLLALITAAILLQGAMRGADADASPASFDLQVYKDQLAEVERDLTRGVVNPEDAERTRTEIARRILAADTAQKASRGVQQGASNMRIWGAVVTLVLLVGSVFIYRQIGVPGYGDLALADRIEAAERFAAVRPDQATAEASVDPSTFPPLPEQNDTYQDLVKQLRAVVEDRPNDARGLQLLAAAERNLGNVASARAAFERYVDIRGEDASTEDFTNLADLMILAAGGYVSPEAEAALLLALERNPNNGAARYFQGLMYSQNGRPDIAFQTWDRLLRVGPADAPWIPPIQAQIDEAAFLAGVRYTQPQPGEARGPSAADLEAAGELTASERLEMIEGMVAGLAERLSSEGGTVEDWARLITSLGVLGRTDDAFAVYSNAVQVFAEDPASMDIINRAGDQAGVAN